MMNTPLHEIKDNAQLDFVLEAIDQADYELYIYQYKLPYLFENTKDASEAIMHLRVLIQNFLRTGLGVIDGSEGTEDDE